MASDLDTGYRSADRLDCIWNSRNSRADQSRWLEDGSFFRLSDITLDIRTCRILSKFGIDRVAAVTLKTWSRNQYSGLDPEFAKWYLYYGTDNSFPIPGCQFAYHLLSNEKIK